MLNLKLIDYQPRWRVWIVAKVAKIMGVLIHVEGIPFGSARIHLKRVKTDRASGISNSIQQGATRVGY